MAKATPASVDDTDEVVAPEVAPMGVAAEIELSGEERRARQSRIDHWRDEFAKMKKVRIRVPEDTRVQVNGYSFLIKGKTSVDVPELVAEVLEQAGRI